MNFAIQVDHTVKLKENKKKDKYLELVRELKKTKEHEIDGDTNSNWCARYSHQKLGTWIGGLENKMTNWDHTNFYIIVIGQNTEKSPENLRRLAVIQTPVKNHQLTLKWKTLKEYILLSRNWKKNSGTLKLPPRQ